MKEQFLRLSSHTTVAQRIFGYVNEKRSRLSDTGAAAAALGLERNRQNADPDFGFSRAKDLEIVTFDFSCINLWVCVPIPLLMSHGNISHASSPKRNSFITDFATRNSGFIPKP